MTSTNCTSSAIIDTLLSRMERRGQTTEESMYEDELNRFLAGAVDGPKDKEPDEVSAALMHAMFDENPKRRYMVVPNEDQADITIRKAIEKLAAEEAEHAPVRKVAAPAAMSALFSPLL